MAITPKTLVVSTTEAAKKRIFAKFTGPRTFAANGAAATLTLVPGTLVALNTSTGLWVPWATGGANDTGIVQGVVWPNPVVLFATGGGEVIGNVMTEGEAFWEDLVGVTGTAAQIAAALQDGATRSPLLNITGLNLVRTIT